MTLNITDAIFSHAQREPHAVAVIDANTIVDYQTLCRGACLAAQRFSQTGWKPGDVVGICLRGSPLLHLVSSLALARMGITQASLPASDPVPLRVSRMARMALTGLVTDHAWIPDATSLATVPPDPAWLEKSAGVEGVSDPRVTATELNWIINETSGTTALPKLIGISHAVEIAYRAIKAPMFAYQPGERVLNLTGLRFTGALRRALCSLSDGATLTFAPSGCSTDTLLQWIDRHHVTYISCVPLHLYQMLHDIRTTSPRLPSVRMLRSSSAPLTVSAVQEIRRRISPNLYVEYGSTEAGSITAATPEMLESCPDTVGLPPAGVELEIVDDQDNPLNHGTPGHVRVRGPGTKSSYLHAGESERARVFKNGWCYPGDVGMRNDAGLLVLKGRSDDIMNFDGILVGPGELESVLREYPAITDAAAFVLPSPEHQDIPAAAYVSAQPLQLVDLSRFCNDRLGVRAPRIFFNVTQIPKNAAGKVLRRHLTDMALKQLQEKSTRR